MRKILIVTLILVFFFASRIEAATCTFPLDRYQGIAGQNVVFTVNTNCNEGELADTLKYYCDDQSATDYSIFTLPCGSFTFNCNYGAEGTHVARAVFYNNTDPPSDTNAKPHLCTNSSGGYFVYADVSPPPSPQITNVEITRTNQSAFISWETKAKDGTLDVTLSRLYLGPSPTDLTLIYGPTQGTAFSHTIQGLLNSTIYYYNITACDEADATNCNSTTGNFITQPTNLSDDASPSPSASPAAERHDLIAVLAGPSDVPKGTQAFFTASIENAGNRDDTFNLRVKDVTGVVESSIYTENNIAISAGSKITRSFEWNTASAAEGMHTITATASLLNYLESTPSDNSNSLLVTVTAARQLPIISNVRVSTVTTSSAIIQWDTDIPSDSNVFYGISRLGDNPARDTARKTAHSITLSSLQPATTYVYKVQSCDGTACASSAEMRFTTGSDPEGVCAPKNYCRPGEAVYVKFAEIQGVCVEQGEGERCEATGCMSPACDVNKGGCYGVPDNSFCKEQCGTEFLKVSGLCVESLAGKTQGECAYTEFPCNVLNECNQQPIACGGKSYYCVQIEGEYGWSELPCDVAGRPVKPTEQPIVSEFATEHSGTVGEGFKDTEELPDEAKFVTRTAIGRLNAIAALKIITEHELVSATEAERVAIFTDSKADITRVICAPPTDSESKCSCEIGYNSSNKNVRCEMAPPVGGTYLITLLNGAAEPESGTLSVILTPGQRAEVRRITVADRENEIIFWFAIAVAALLFSAAMGGKVYRGRKEKKMGPEILRALQLIPEQQKQLQYSFMKGTITESEFKTSNMALDKRKAELEARLKEYNRKHPNRKVVRLDEEKFARSEEAKPARKLDDFAEYIEKPESTKKEISKTPSEIPKSKPKKEETEELDMLLDELKSKGVGKGKK